MAKADDGMGGQELSGEEDSKRPSREVVKEVARSALVLLFSFPGMDRLKYLDIARCWDIFSENQLRGAETMDNRSRVVPIAKYHARLRTKTVRADGCLVFEVGYGGLTT